MNRDEGEVRQVPEDDHFFPGPGNTGEQDNGQGVVKTRKNDRSIVDGHQLKRNVT